MRPATLVYYGCSAADVCAQLKRYPASLRTQLAVDALIVAFVFSRLDTLNVLCSIGTPLEEVGFLGISFNEVYLKGGGAVVRELLGSISGALR